MRQAQAGMIHLTLTTAKNVGIVTTCRWRNGSKAEFPPGVATGTAGSFKQRMPGARDLVCFFWVFFCLLFFVFFVRTLYMRSVLLNF